MLVIAVAIAKSTFAFVPCSSTLAMTRRSLLAMAPKETPSEAIARRGERKGFYVRPSAAIEKGGGFFIPGLEGWKLRGLISTVVGVLLLLNRSGGYEPTPSQLVSEGIAATAAILLVFQTFTQLLWPGDGLESSSVSDEGATSTVRRRAFARPGASYDSAMWAANALLDTSKGSVVILVRKGAIEALAGTFEVNHPVLEEEPEDTPSPLLKTMSFLAESVVLNRASPQLAPLLQYAPSSCTSFFIRALSSDTAWVVGASDAAVLQAENQQAWIGCVSKFVSLEFDEPTK